MNPELRFSVSRLMQVAIWLSLPLALLIGASEKITVSVAIFTGFIAFSHICLIFINRDLVNSSNKWQGYLLILLFGPIETDRLKKMTSTPRKAGSNNAPDVENRRNLEN